MKLSEYIQRQKPSVVQVQAGDEILWRIYSSSRSEELLMVPSPAQRELARGMFEQQAQGASGAALWKARSRESSDLRIFPKVEARFTQMWFVAQLDEPARGRWTELEDRDGTRLHAWHCVEVGDHKQRLTWRMSPDLRSHIAGPLALGDYRAGLATTSNSPYLKVWRLGPAAHHTFILELNGAQGPDFGEDGGDEHALRWRQREDNQPYGPQFSRRFSIDDKAFRVAFGLQGRLRVEARQTLTGKRWQLQSVFWRQVWTRVPPHWENTPTDLRDVWNGAIADPTHRALTGIKGGVPVSIVPRLEKELAKNLFYAHIYGFDLDSGAADEGLFVLEQSGFFDTHDGFAGPQEHEQSFSWPALKDVEGRSIEAAGIVTTRFGAKLDKEVQGDDGTVFELFVRKHEVEAKVRDGALELHFGGELPKNKSHYGRLRATLFLRDEQRPLFLFQWDESMRGLPLVLSYAVEDLTFGVKAVGPAGQDARPEDEYLAPRTTGSVVQGSGERTEPALVIPLQPADAENVLWIANESTSVAQSLRLDVRLQRFANESAGERVPDPSPADVGVQRATVSAVVLDSAPQMVALVQTQLFPPNARESGAYIVARRSPLSEERDGWELFDERARHQGFALVLPAQALGEQMIKLADDLPEKEGIADFRFGPPAELRLSPERLERGFVAAAWNLRRTLLERGNASPGLPLLSADFELLYGLEARLERSGLLLTDLASKLGELPTPALPKPEWSPTDKQRDAFRRTWRNYLQVFRAWSTRLCLLELSQERAPLRPLKLDQGITYRIRVAARNGSQAGPAGAQLAWPRPYGSSTDAGPAPRTEEQGELAQYHSLDGLRGGALWGFEQLEIYKELWRHRERSSSGELAEVAFSSLGGYGKQTARFVHDKTTIQSVTTLGRTHVYSVERIGRIGVLWNKAKHVVLFERTVVPSAQKKQGKQPAQTGRVLCRMVSEFVEILELESRYPDGAGQDASAAGAVQGCVFRTRIFPVESSWGRTVFGEDPAVAIGWELPLWREGLDARVYPKPQVSLKLTPPADSDVEAVLVDLEQPQMLRFYTDLRETDAQGQTLTSDVRKWPVVAGVDYVNQPDPEVPNIAPFLARDSAGMDAPLPGAVAVPPGFERVTFLVTPSEVPADVAGRYFKDANLTGRMRSVTLMRSRPNTDAKTREQWWQARKVGALLHGKDSLATQSANGFVAALKDLASADATPANLTLDVFQAQTATWLQAVKDALGADVGDTLRTAHFRGLYPLDLKSSPGKALWREVLESADGIVVRVMALFADAARALLDARDQQLDPSTLRGVVDSFDESMQAFPWQATWRRHGTLTKVRSLLDGWKAQVSQALGACIQDQVLARLRGIQDHATPERIGEARQQLKRLIEVAQEEATKLLSTTLPLDELRRVMLSNLDLSCAAARADVDEIVDAVGKISGAFAERVRQLELQLLKAITAAFDEFELVDKAEEALATGIDIADALRAELRSSKFLDRLRGLALGAALPREMLETLAHELQSKLVAKLTLALSGPEEYTPYRAILALEALFLKLGQSLLDHLLGHSAADAAQALFGRLPAALALAEAIRRGDPGALIIERANALAEEIHGELGQLAGTVADLQRDLSQGKDAVQAASAVLRNARSAWHEFSAPGLGFNRRTIELVARFDAKHRDERLGMTPTVARLKQVGERLEELGLRVPVVGVADRLLSATQRRFAEYSESLLDQVGFSDIVSDIAGLKLTRLFPGLKFPGLSADDLKVSHGFDKEQLKAWAQAKVDLRLRGSQTLLSLGALQVSMKNAHLTADVKLEANSSGRVEKVARGALQGDWTLRVGGVEFMSYDALKISFENGKLDFALDPKTMRSSGLLRLLTDVSQDIPFENGSFNLGIVKHGPLPVGLRASLALGPWDGSGGVSGISNLLFGGFFELSLADKQFALATGFYLGKQESPFDLQVCILGGGGYFSMALLYKPLTNALTVDLALAVHASASLRIDAGWMRGGVALYLGLEADYKKRPNSSPTLRAGQFVMVEGYVRILSIVTVNLTLRLACALESHASGTELHGSGVVSVQVRLSRFYKVRVRRSYQRVLAKSERRGSHKALLQRDECEARSHIEMLAP